MDCTLVIANHFYGHTHGTVYGETHCVAPE